MATFASVVADQRAALYANDPAKAEFFGRYDALTSKARSALGAAVPVSYTGDRGGNMTRASADFATSVSRYNATPEGRLSLATLNEGYEKGYIKRPFQDWLQKYDTTIAAIGMTVLSAGALGAFSSGIAATDTAAASDAGMLYAPSASSSTAIESGAATAAASDAGTLYAPAAASGTPIAPAAALKPTAAGSLVSAVKDVSQVAGAAAGLAGAASAIRKATMFPSNANDLVPTTPAGIVTPADQVVPGQGVSSSTLWIIAAVVGVILFRS